MAETTPVSQKRLQVRAAMSPPLQKEADAIELLFKNAACGSIIVHYQVGQHVSDIMENPGLYGESAVKDLAKYFGSDDTTWYALRSFVNEFALEFVQDKSSVPMANGRFMALTHWLLLSKLKDRKEQERTLKRIITESISSTELEKEIRAGTIKSKKSRAGGGRKPSTPSSPINGLQTAFSMAQKFANYGDVFEASVCDILDELPPDRVTQALEDKINDTVLKFNEMLTVGEQALARLNENLARVHDVLAQKATEGEPDGSEAEGAGEAKAEKKLKKDKAKATKEVEAGVEKVTKPKATGKPKAAVAGGKKKKKTVPAGV